MIKVLGAALTAFALGTVGQLPSASRIAPSAEIPFPSRLLQLPTVLELAQRQVRETPPGDYYPGRIIVEAMSGRALASLVAERGDRVGTAFTRDGAARSEGSVRASVLVPRGREKAKVIEYAQDPRVVGVWLDVIPVWIVDGTAIALTSRRSDG